MDGKAEGATPASAKGTSGFELELPQILRAVPKEVCTFPTNNCKLYSSKMPYLLRPTSRLFARPMQRCAYSSAQSPVVKVINYPAPHSGNIRILSLSRPAARNAISKQMLSELNQQITSIHNEGQTGPTRALILASEVDTSFCAGADLKERATFTQEE